MQRRIKRYGTTIRRRASFFTKGKDVFNLHSFDNLAVLLDPRMQCAWKSFRKSHWKGSGRVYLKLFLFFSINCFEFFSTKILPFLAKYFQISHIELNNEFYNQSLYTSQIETTNNRAMNIFVVYFLLNNWQQKKIMIII